MKISSTFFTAASVATVLAAPAIAETTKIEAGAFYQNISIEGVDLRTTGFGALYEGKVDRLSYSVSAASANMSFSGGASVASQAFGVLGGYEVVDGLKVIAGFDHTKFDDFAIRTLSFGATYEMSDFTFGAMRSRASSDFGDADVNSVFAGYDNGTLHGSYGMYWEQDFPEDTFASLEAGYTNEMFEVSVSRISLDEVAVLGVTGQYNIGSNMRASAGYSTVTGFGLDVNMWTLGGGYMVTDNVWIDAGIGGINIEDVSANSLSLAITFEMGDDNKADFLTQSDLVDFQTSLTGL